MDFAKEIRDRRKELNVTQKELADSTEISIRSIKMIERGDGNPSLKTVEKLADFLGLELSLNKKNFPMLTNE